ncbi:MAG: EamA family transporter [Pseudomonadota bacterium]
MIGRVYTLISKNATAVGYVGVLMWALTATFTAELSTLPVFEILSIAFSINFSISFLRISLGNKWQQLRQPIGLWVLGIIGIFGNEMLYIMAFKHAPPAHADLINYLWPIMVIFLSSVILKEALSLKHIIAGLLGFFATYLLITNGQGLAGFHSEYAWGYVFAFCSALSWSLYTLVGKKYGETIPEIIGIYCGIGMLCSLILHVQLEPNVVPTLTQWIVLLLMGLTTHGLAYFFWNHGVKLGNYRLLSVMCYANPIISVSLLVFLGFAQPSASLWTSAALVSLAGLVGTLNWRTKSQYCMKQWRKMRHREK